MKINQNPNFGTHNTSVRNGSIQYICIHYVGAEGDAKQNVNYYNRKTSTSASADFFVGHKGDIWQYNPNPKDRYCWAVGGSRQSSHGGSFYGKAKNYNSISIEMCVKTKGSKAANSKDWYFTNETIESTIELTKYLMKLYNVPSSRVIRHYDVTGKYCPGVFGWNDQTGSEREWESFKSKLTGSSSVSWSTNAPSNQSGGSGTVTIELPVLKKGSTGNSVKTLQIFLNGFGYNCGTVDGSFGAKTLSAVKQFQSKNKLSVDGSVGKATWTALLK